MPNLRQAYATILPLVEQPARYTGGERGTIVKDSGQVRLRFALAFPEVYEIAQSHLGLQILYDLLNGRPDIQAERAYAPWGDMEALLRQRGLPLASLDTCSPLVEFDIIGFSLQYELTYTNILMMLDLGGIPLLARERTAEHPLVIAGGPCAFHPEPLADFIDAFLLGDGEEAIFDICDAHLAWDKKDRLDLLRALSRIPGVYVPAFFSLEHTEDGTLCEIRSLDPAQAVVHKRVVSDLNSIPPLKSQVVPNVNIVHDRIAVEVMRGCVRGCRFCQAGYIYRPLRERDPRALQQQIEKLVEQSGYEEVSLLSLSTGDYSCVNPLLREVMNRFAGLKVSVSLPSTRVDALSPHILEEIRRVRKTGFTLAPEAGSQRLRDVIQKEYKEEELVEAANMLFGLGWKSVKLYFMLGLPSETEEDLLGIVDLSRKVSAAGKHRRQVTASVSTFVPKPHTPFQWAAQLSLEETEARQELLRKTLRRYGIQFKWHDARLSFLEGVFARGDRRLAAPLLTAYRLGCRFDGWTEQFRLDLWQQAFAAHGIDPDFYLRRRLLDEPLPWDHLDSGVTKKWLQRDLAKAFAATLTPDCSVERCSYCGACDFKTVRNVTYHLNGAKGADHRGPQVDTWAATLLPEQTTWGTRQWQMMQGKRKVRGQEKSEVRSPEESGVRSPESGVRSPEESEGRSPGEFKVQRSTFDVQNPQSVICNPQSSSGNAEDWLAGDPNTIAASRAEKRPAVARVRISYSKLAEARFLGAKETATLFARATRRARLPVAYSQGFHPLPRLSFGPALPLGIESEEEFLDIELTEALPAPEVGRRLDAELPGGFTVSWAQTIDLRDPSIDASIRSFHYTASLESLPVDKQESAFLAAKLNEFHASPTFPLRKHTRGGEKIVDAKQFVSQVALTTRFTLHLETQLTSAGTIKSHEFVGTLFGLSPEEIKVLRLRKIQTCFHSLPHASAGPQSEEATDTPL
ncbi:MAG: TIGR03960 family B12-binding radical SAM protein [Deltaproteobacteria bacterium]|nr:TIGR03960 family B12-binding radical SAM protein [Deltaproteobacteria bacterium]